MKHASLFSGIGGFDLAAEWMGWVNVFHCEINPWCSKILNYHFPQSKSYEDITKTDFTPWRGKIDILTGGFPCQPFSVAGGRKGQDDDRYLWPQMLRAIREIRPTWVIGENVAGIISMVQPGEEITVESQASLFETADKETIHDQEFVIESVCRDLECEGYTVQPLVIPACAVGAPHRRDRVWFIAYRADTRFEGLQCGGQNGVCKSNATSNTDSIRSDRRCANSNWPQEAEKERTSIFIKTHRSCCKRSSSNSNGERCNHRSDNWKERSLCYDKERNTQEDQPKWTERKRRVSKNGLFTNSFSKRRAEKCIYNDTAKQSIQEAPERKPCRANRKHSPSNWEDFPTQSPICSRDDGVSYRLDAITFSKWREESIKGYGNAIVPQVAFEIFKSIEVTINI